LGDRRWWLSVILRLESVYGSWRVLNHSGFDLIALGVCCCCQESDQNEGYDCAVTHVDSFSLYEINDKIHE
jgi:hypothetical protein